MPDHPDGTARSYRRLAHYDQPDKADPSATIPRGHRAPTGPVAAAWDRATGWAHTHHRATITAAGTAAIALIGSIAIAATPDGTPTRPRIPGQPPAQAEPLPPIKPPSLTPLPEATTPRARPTRARKARPKPVRTKTRTLTPTPAKPSSPPPSPRPTFRWPLPTGSSTPTPTPHDRPERP